MTRVKVCGTTRVEDAAAAVEAGADALGVIVDVPVDTPREVSPARASEIVASVPPFVSTVLVTMADPDRATALADDVGTDAVQLHGDPDPDAVAAIERPTLVSVDAADTDAAHRYAAVADAVLVDSTDDAGAGGTGRTHDWAAARELRDALDAPLVLAGGLTPDNVGEAVETVAPYAVDVASGVEARGGEKDHDAVRDFVARAKRGVPA